MEREHRGRGECDFQPIALRPVPTATHAILKHETTPKVSHRQVNRTFQDKTPPFRGAFIGIRAWLW
jgi:hypothetical protein